MRAPFVWPYDKNRWKLYTENWGLAKHLRRRASVVNAGRYFSPCGEEFGWDFILRGWSLKYEVMSHWRRMHATSTRAK